METIGAVLIAFGLGLWIGWALRSREAERDRIPPNSRVGRDHIDIKGPHYRL